LLESEENIPDFPDIARHCGYENSHGIRREHFKLFKALSAKLTAQQKVFLHDLIDKKSNMGLSEACRREGYHPRTVRFRHPALCQQYVDERAQRKYDRVAKHLSWALSQDNEELPSLADINRAVGAKREYLIEHFPRDFEELQVRYEQTRQRELDRVRTILDEELMRTPPRSLNKICDEIERSVIFVTHNFSDRVKHIVERYKAEQTARKEARYALVRATVLQLHQDGQYPNINKVENAFKTIRIYRGTPERKAYVQAMRECGYDIDD
jgi:hypothetical protein